MNSNKLNRNRYSNQIDSSITLPGRSFIVTKNGI